MNLALPALVVFLLLLPGFIARSRVKRAERQSLDYSPFGQIVSEAVLWAIALHLLWVALIGIYAGKEVDSQTLLLLMSAEPRAQTQALHAVAAQADSITMYFTTLLVFAHLSPWVLRSVVERFRLDREHSRWSPLLRFSGAPWYYLFSGADFEESDVPDLISVSAVVDVAGEPYLFVGLLDDYFMRQDGELDRVILQYVIRRPLIKDKGPDHVQGDLSRFYPIDGDYFVLRYAECITLNIEYIKLGLAGAIATGEQSEPNSPQNVEAAQSGRPQAASADFCTPPSALTYSGRLSPRDGA